MTRIRARQIQRTAGGATIPRLTPRTVALIADRPTTPRVCKIIETVSIFCLSNPVTDYCDARPSTQISRWQRLRPQMLLELLSFRTPGARKSGKMFVELTSCPRLVTIANCQKNLSLMACLIVMAFSSDACHPAIFGT